MGKEGDGEGEDRDEKAGDEAGKTAGESDNANAQKDQAYKGTRRTKDAQGKGDDSTEDLQCEQVI